MKENQNGRSMIEMLGVLAIIGVLSIGGIAGYSKAMSKYRVNKTADQISQLAQNIRVLYSSQKNYSGLNYNVIKKAHLAPDDMYETTSTTNLTHPFGGLVEVGVYGKMSGGDNKAFLIRLDGIPQEACIELLTQDWGAGASSGLIALGAGSHGEAYYNNCSNSSSRQCASQGVMPVNTAISICSGAINNNITWKFY